MVFSNDDKAVIKKDFVENGWSPYRTAKSKKTKKWYKGSVQRWINQFIERGTMERKSGSGRPRSVRNQKKEQIVEQLICLQEESSGSHKSPQEIERHTGIKRLSEWLNGTDGNSIEGSRPQK